MDALKNRFIIFLLFITGYATSENLIQPFMIFPQWIRWHLSDFFAGPVFAGVWLLLIIPRKHLNQSLLITPIISLSVCIIIELISHTDYIDIVSYIAGFISYYLLVYLIERNVVY